ncbi:MAG: DNA polymerase III subunit epsilon [Gammaproteobacteria bacterium]
MRQIVLDTETTGLEPARGHRIIEIGCVELHNRRMTSRTFHHYINPGREIDDGAFEVHGISNEFLSSKPGFKDIAQEFIDFIRDCEVIIHNAPFDVGFINAELEQLGPAWGRLEDYCRIVDTLVMAREKHPGLRNSLDALCQRYKVDNSCRELHGALLDARILLDVYLAMTGGQTDLSLDDQQARRAGVVQQLGVRGADRPPLRVIDPTSTENELHQKRLDAIDRKSGGKCVWKINGD